MQYINVDDNQQLGFANCDKPQISAEQCLVKVHAIGVNRADLLQRQGKYPPPAGESHILGLEVSGDVVAIGENVTNISLGDRICGLVAGGGYAEYVAIQADHIIPIPNHFSYVQGAAIAEVYLTAFQSLFCLADLQPDEQVLIHGGASGVGSAALMLAKAINANVTVTISSDVKANACIELGADQVINYRQESFVDWKKQHKPKGFDVIIDIVGGDNVNKNIDALAVDGRIVILAILGGRFCEQLDIAKMLFKRAKVQASTLRNRSDVYKADLVLGFKQRFYEALQNGQISPVIDRVFAWQEADEAHQLMSRNSNIGKYILTTQG
ncbi:NAD(P)H-quinone oxidoreductase [Thalassotalea sp. HSM 43]|uniref:NAD(P)H-quinone oxidoreductase n=1 Tax=Thalassotalea sp. HSM 43 TaxID=2552945 RepID=UPI00108198A3|nr:NAD(P)H-quinone oxidoreductase [Thalassotalea sp. HSM 43]QBY02876.1 NAD(P)H-quinone oxidoreductase [Thalassotalea sp. HSM 43]